MLDPDAGDSGHAQKLGGFHPAVAGQNIVLPVNQDRIGEPKLFDAVGNLPDLLLGMGPSILRLRFEL